MDEWIEYYFRRGLQYADILNLMNQLHGVTLSMRQLHRILSIRNLYRRKNKTNINEVIVAIDEALHGSRQNFGYRLMTQWLTSQGLITDRETVRLALKELDPEGVLSRQSHRFRRRVYVSNGPNFIWHIDGYDKIKPFGLAIHGAIDGWSRKLLWLSVGSSNNNPRMMASHFTRAVSEAGLVPRFVRGDRGGENVVIAGIQRFFHRQHDDDGFSSFQFGSSIRNQRIEAWWSVFRRNRANFWINFFKDMCDQQIYDPSIQWQLDLFRYCFLGLVQTELDETLELWNHHRIRPVRNSECPSGLPFLLYTLPNEYGGEESGMPLSIGDFNLSLDHVSAELFLGCPSDIRDLITILRRENNFAMPTTPQEAKQLFIDLSREL
eukprot:TCONS_00059777-protein